MQGWQLSNRKPGSRISSGSPTRVRVGRFWAVLNCCPMPQAGSWMGSKATWIRIGVHAGSQAFMARISTVMLSNRAQVGKIFKSPLIPNVKIVSLKKIQLLLIKETASRMTENGNFPSRTEAAMCV